MTGPEAGDRVLVLAPHPDDESLGAGGLLARTAIRGGSGRVIFATDGDNAPWIQRVAERRWRIAAADRERFGATRRLEARAALAALGLADDAALFLGGPDSGLTADLLRGGEEIIRALAADMNAWQPTCVVLPSLLDLHPDHSALAVLARFALDRVEDPPPRLLSYLVHGLREWPASGTIAFQLTEEEQQRKRAAVLCHATQLAVHRRAYLDMVTGTESFSEEGAAVDPRHPIQRVEWLGGRVHFDTRSRARIGAHGRTRVFVIAQDGSLRDTYSFMLRPGRTRLTRALAGDAVGDVTVDGRRGARGVRIEAAELAQARRLFAKLERRAGFFDEAGWIELGRTAPGPALAAPDASAGRSRATPPAVCVVVPCFDVARYCEAVVLEAAHTGASVLAVDDGSRDGTAEALRRAASNGPVRVVTLPENAGKGVALIEAFRVALADIPFDVLVTMDGDSQHRPSDIPALVTRWQEGADLVVGERSLSDMSPKRRWGNDFMAAVMRSIYPHGPTDTQSGFRAFDRTLVESILARVAGARYDTELRMLLLALAEARPIATVGIPTLYVDDNRSSHYRGFTDSLRIWIALTDACYLPRWTDKRAWQSLFETFRSQR